MIPIVHVFWQRNSWEWRTTTTNKANNNKKNEGGNIIPDVGTKNLPIGEYWKITNTFMS